MASPGSAAGSPASGPSPGFPGSGGFPASSGPGSGFGSPALSPQSGQGLAASVNTEYPKNIPSELVNCRYDMPDKGPVDGFEPCGPFSSNTRAPQKITSKFNMPEGVSNYCYWFVKKLSKWGQQQDRIWVCNADLVWLVDHNGKIHRACKLIDVDVLFLSLKGREKSVAVRFRAGTYEPTWILTLQANQGNTCCRKDKVMDPMEPIRILQYLWTAARGGTPLAMFLLPENRDFKSFPQLGPFKKDASYRSPLKKKNEISKREPAPASMGRVAPRAASLPLPAPSEPPPPSDLPPPSEDPPPEEEESPGSPPGSPPA
eukprot:Hpha_TRINITY_DN2414_c0_g1::TRINITY_DN2414_c0_g1_i1::g.24735::m.24735